MAKLLRTNLKPAKVGVKEYSSPFSLLPPNEVPPNIDTQPIDSVQQTTWILRYEQSTPIFQTIQPKQNRVVMIQGTAFSLETFASDPSNNNLLNQPSKLSYKWKRDESLLTAFSKGVGKTKLTISRQESVPSKSGAYTCEVTNAYGTTSTNVVNIEIIDPDNHPKLYKNLIINGDGSGGTDGWETQGGIKSEAFQEHLVFGKNFASFQLGGLITFKKGQEEANMLPPEFRFSNASHYGLFFPWYLKRYEKDSTFKDINVKSPSSNALNTDESYISEGILPQILPNEDYGVPNAKVAGFFPGPLWMDRYNKNSNPEQTNLSTEIHQKNLTYLTRDKLKFTNTGGTTEASLSQTIDVSDLADAIDGNAYGIKYISSQFFAYIGTGITGYQIKARVRKDVTEPFIEKTFNYYIGDSEAYKKMFAQEAYKDLDVVYAEGPNGPFKTYEDLAKIYNPDTLSLDVIQKADEYALLVPKIQKQLDDAIAERTQLGIEISTLDEEVKELHKENNLRLTALIAAAVGVSALLFTVLSALLPIATGAITGGFATAAGISFTASGAIAAISSAFLGALTGLAAPVIRYVNFKRDEKLKERSKLEKSLRLNTLNDAIIPGFTYQLAQATKELSALNEKKWLVLYEQQAFFQAQLQRSYLLEDKSSIEITPIASDTTEVVLEYLDRNGVTIKEERIKGPSFLDIWAVKEKVFFPLTLHPLFTFLRPSSFDANVVINVLGQKYTTTNVLRPFFTREEIGRGVGLLSQGINSLKDDATFNTINPYELATPVQDKNALFLLRKYDFTRWGVAYPPDNGDYALPNSVRKYTAQNAVLDLGAAAMFGVGRNTILPVRTRSIRVKVIFSHNSSVIEDITASLKGWQDSEVYSDVYGQTSGTSKRLVEYGNPRCGITAMKLLLAVNNIAVDDKHVTYSMPPALSTTLGLLYNRYKDPNAFNTADIPTFNYKIYQPQILQEAPVILNPFEVNPTPPTPPQGTTSGPSKGTGNNLTIVG